MPMRTILGRVDSDDIEPLFNDVTPRSGDFAYIYW